MSKVKVGDEIKLIKKMGPFTEIGTVCKVEDTNDEGIKFSSPTYCGYGYMSEDELNTYFEIVKEDDDISDDELQDSINELKEKLSKLEKIVEEREEKARIIPLKSLSPGDRFVTSGKREYVVLAHELNETLITTYNPYDENNEYKLIQFNDELNSDYRGSNLEEYINNIVYPDLYYEFSEKLLCSRFVNVVTLDGSLVDTLTNCVFPITFDEVRKYKKYLTNKDFDKDEDIYWTISPWSNDVVFNGDIVCAYFIGGISNNCICDDIHYIRPTCLVYSDFMVKRVDDQE